MLLPSLLFLSLGVFVQAGDQCKIGSKKIMYYFEPNRMACFPQMTIECSQEATERYETLRECQRRRLPMDFNMCAANFPAVKRPNGESHCFHETMPEFEQNKCPEGSFCNFGFRVGICCDKKIEDEYNAEAHAACPEGKKAIRTPGDEFDRPVFGKECSHNFCPADTSCQQGKYLAWCCK
ncbi:hypothetical protein PFISCL1PPCAC_2090 [Pristionchus fissidentatus]|uniref:BPTI/Kunitz inhibitor domain-containing protein n=1 Tax=Pristionchus fissidentatus TaxID=1538716 RepID=A0AAV5UX51_9BILA|nr:hypothetical protein PFISCL1PPCAC_2090 [Pristionchus fissidentatus]